ncbi:MAG: ferrous iron transport protein A [Gemmatales bacterium]|nr:ferrous iron transport protein A [Gemmatales bacterium]MCS7159627.1 ferrous iron transport protein A [Gemmatales bacterium]MDW8174825.1 ferrous iron transport protein A [Gemmatales bacterium]MDW8223662.1 ferrous iron transport protein A [Gemmatales bacterium]
MSVLYVRRLNELLPGQRGHVVAIEGNDHISRRLMEMGLLEGELIEVLALAPLGDPMEIKIGSYRLSLRSSEAQRVSVCLNVADDH